MAISFGIPTNVAEKIFGAVMTNMQTELFAAHLPLLIEL